MLSGHRLLGICKGVRHGVLVSFYATPFYSFSVCLLERPTPESAELLDYFHPPLPTPQEQAREAAAQAARQQAEADRRTLELELAQRLRDTQREVWGPW